MGSLSAVVNRKNPLRRRAPKYCYFKKGRSRGYWYFMRPGFKSAQLPGLPWSPDFMAAYYEAMRGEMLEKGKGTRAPAYPGKGIGQLVLLYKESSAFKTLAENTKLKYGRFCDRIRDEMGADLVTELQHVHVYNIHQSMQDTPSQANSWLKVMNNLMIEALNQGWRVDNPCRHVKKLNEEGAATPPWTAKQRREFERHWPIGTRERLAYELHYATDGQRSCDIFRLGGKHRFRHEDGREYLRFVLQKTRRYGMREKVSFISERLAHVLAVSPVGKETFITTEKGGAYASAESYKNWFNDAIRDAGRRACGGDGSRHPGDGRYGACGGWRRSFDCQARDRPLDGWSLPALRCACGSGPCG
jgi:hypothetical protein